MSGTGAGVRLREAKRQARSFEEVRRAHQQEVAQDYLELIADLIDVMGEARTVDLAARLGVTAATVNSTLQRLVREGLVRKERYRSIFLTEAGRRLAELPFITLCYRRPRRPPAWPYNLFCMIHGRERATVLGQIEAATRAAGLHGRSRAVLFSRRCFKQRGARYAAPLPMPEVA